jgi:membrane associated rhomboid family serine protease
MIHAICNCGWNWNQAESAPKPAATCPHCKKSLRLACAETLPDGAGGGDFDAVFDIVGGPPDRVGERIFLGGVLELSLGKLDTNHVPLPGKMVSRQHCRLSRVDFGPSRWSIADKSSTNGLFVNDHRVESKELADGDVITIGEYKLKFGHTQEPAPVATPAAPPPPQQKTARPRIKVTRFQDAAPPTVAPGTGVPCPSCANELPAKAKICVACGIKLDSGRPLLLSAGRDEDVVHGTAEQAIWWASWLMPVTLMPMPLVSEAYGKHKPWTIRSIAAVTALASLIFLITSFAAGENADEPGKQLELWAPQRQTATADVAAPTTAPATVHETPRYTREEVQEFIDDMDEDDRQEFESVKNRLRGKYPNSQLNRRAAEEMMRKLDEDIEKEEQEFERAVVARSGHFAWYQLFTHALLHDNTSIIGFIGHLGGNLLFLLVFGSRVNALLGNFATAIVYPALAAGSAAVFLWLGHPPPNMAMLGASGAIMGLAGMYFVLFPVHLVYCGMWLRLWFYFRTWLFLRVFVLRGFWVLLMYFAYDALMTLIGIDVGTAHWAHIGGFVIGMCIAIVLLFSRLIYCGGGDLFNVALGKYAWPLIGRPARWHKLSYPASN